MNKALRIVKWTGISVLSLAVILFCASLLLQDKVAGIIVKSLNNTISTKLEFGSLKLSFIRRFPNASLELKDVLVNSSDSFNGAPFTGINTDTLLAAKFVTVEFSIRDIINGVYNIERVSAEKGAINLFSDKSGGVNYDIAVKNETSSGDDFTIDLQKITLTEMKTTYWNLATQLKLNGIIESGRIKSRISGENIDFIADGDMQFTHLQLYNTSITKAINASFDLKLQSSTEGIIFEKGNLEIESYSFDLSGTYSAASILDLKINGNNIDISEFKKYLPEKQLAAVYEYNPSGILTIRSTIKGELSRVSNPHIEVDYSLQNGKVSFGKSAITINGLSFTGSFSNGSRNLPSTSFIKITDLKARLGSAGYSGTFSLSDFNNPVTEITLNGKVIPGELKEFFDIEIISSSEGSVDMDLSIKSDFAWKNKPTIDEIIDMKPRVVMNFNSLSIGLKKEEYRLGSISGKLKVDELAGADNLEFYYKGQKIGIDGEFRNLSEWLAGRPVLLSGAADIKLNRLVPELLKKEFSDASKSSSAETAFNLPDDLALDINFEVDSFRYKTFSSTGLKGTLNYKPGLLTFKSLNMKTLSGSVSGTGFVVQNRNKTVIAKGIFDIKEIDVNKTFIAFKNFGQDFIKAENLKGTLSGSLSLLLPMDSMLNPQIKAITAEGKYTLVNGSLINFEPVKELSDFIELSELENISFEKLENDFFIRNNILYTPQMDVNSSAADLSINGKHSFDNDYEYHVKMLLSEILSKKRKKTRSNVTEFGVVEDDGLGRTSILLKIVGAGEDVKVSYDLKAAGNEVKKNIKTERQTLKTILNQEYGWYKSDTVAKPKTPEKKSRFKISFGEDDTSKVTTDPVPAKKESTVKSIFKKK